MSQSQTVQIAPPTGKTLVTWRFDFNDNKPSRIGMWNLPATRQSDMAAFINKDGLTRASIQAKDFASRKVYTMAEVDGHDFINFEWIAQGAVPGPGFRRMSMQGSIVGIRLRSRDWLYECFTDGRVVKKPRPDVDKVFNYVGFGK